MFMGGSGTAASLFDRLLHHVGRRKIARKPKSTNQTNRNKANSILYSLNDGHLEKAISILCSTQEPVTQALYARLFQSCSSKRALNEAKMVQTHLSSSSTNPSLFLLNRAIETYAKCGSLVHARQMFDKMPERDGGSWNALISGYSQVDCAEEALFLFSQMNRLAIRANEVTFACVLGSCAAVLALVPAMQIHGLLIRLGHCSNVILGSALVDVYGKCGVMEDARRIFDEIPRPNAVSWNVIIRRYFELGKEEEALLMFFRMAKHDVKPLNFTIACVLKACSTILALKQGLQIHGIIVLIGFEDNDVVTSSLIDMYAKCGNLDDARWIFDRICSRNVVSWTAIVSGYAKCGKIDEALKLFQEMPERNVVSWNAMLAGLTGLSYWEEALEFVRWMRRMTKDIDHVTLILIVSISSGLSDLELGKQVHAFVYRHGYFADLSVANSLIHMYGKCGSLRSADILFSKMEHRDRISWNALLVGYASHRQSEEALVIFGKMQRETIPNEFTLSNILAACSNILSLGHGKEVHGYTIRNGLEMDIVTRGALVDMYSKCHCLEYAFKVFGQVGCPDVILWNSMIRGCAYNRRGREALELFDSMQRQGIHPDHITFVGVLLACISERFVDLGLEYFASMSVKYCVIPRVEHYECMINLLGGNRVMDELEDFICKMPFGPTPKMWMSILESCKVHGNSRLGKRAAEHIRELNPENQIGIEIYL